MSQINFDPLAPILLFQCRIEYLSVLALSMALDTGASSIIIPEKAASKIGFDLDEIGKKTTFSDASTSHFVPVVTLKSFSLADARVEDIEVLCYTIPEEHGIDGVIGLNFLRHFKVALDFQSGTLTLEQFGAR